MANCPSHPLICLAQTLVSFSPPPRPLNCGLPHKPEQALKCRTSPYTDLLSVYPENKLTIAEHVSSQTALTMLFPHTLFPKCSERFLLLLKM